VYPFVLGVGMSVRRILLWLGLVCLMSGCQSLPQPQADAPPSNTPLAVTSRQLHWPDLSTVSATSRLPSYKQAISEPYFQLTAEECRTRACQNASLANFLQKSASSTSHIHSTATRQEVDELRRKTASHLSREIRNRTSGAALDLYYRLLEAELLMEVLDASQTEIDALVDMAEKVIRQGAKQAPDLDLLRKQQIETRSDMAKLQAGIQRLNAELKGLLKEDRLEGNLLPADTIQIPSEPLEIDGLVTVGLNQRPDLHVLRELIAGLNPETVAPIKQSLALLVPPLGAVQALTRTLLPGLQSLLSSHSASDLVQIRSNLKDALRVREQEAARDIRTAANEWESQRLLVGIAKQRVEFEAQRIREFEVLKKAGRPVELDLRKAKLDRLKAEAELVRESIKWKRADVKTRLEMGILCSVDEACVNSIPNQ
jgi:hypothetical protein